MQNRLARADVPVDLTWNLDDLFASVADWEAEAEALDAARAEVHPHQGRLGESAATLLACLDTVEMLEQRLMRVGAFGYLLNAQDGTDPRVTEYYVGTKGVAEPSKGPKSDKRTRPLPLAEGYIQEHRDLIKSVEDGKPLNEGKQVADTTLASIMGRMSAYTGKLVTWDDAMKSTEDTFPKHVAFGPMPVPPVAVPGKATVA